MSNRDEGQARYSTSCDTDFPAQYGKVGVFRGLASRRQFFFVEQEDRMLQRVENLGSLIRVPLALRASKLLFLPSQKAQINRCVDQSTNSGEVAFPEPHTTYCHFGSTTKFSLSEGRHEFICGRGIVLSESG